jgi:hypothetical protein
MRYESVQYIEDDTSILKTILLVKSRFYFQSDPGRAE